MSFLLHAGAKISAGKRMRAITYQMSTITRQLTRATKNIAKMESNLTKDFNSKKAAMQSTLNNQLSTQYQESFGTTDFTNGGAIQKMSTEKRTIATQEYTSYQQMAQAQYTEALALFESNYETFREAQLEPLQALEDSLQVQKDSLESQLQVATADYEAHKEAEKSDKSYVMSYTGQ
ncbi:MAG: hypothetical protein R3Y28_06540 [Candidatus Gastranaerophilales bacterium]